MAFLNSATLLNMGADAVKTASANQVSQDAQSNGSDEFAQALRKQMQQSSKPVIPTANKATDKVDAPKPEPTKSATAEKAPAAPNNTVKSEDSPQKTAADSSDEHTSAEAAASTEETAASATTSNTKDPADVIETAQERKKTFIGRPSRE